MRCEFVVGQKVVCVNPEGQWIPVGGCDNNKANPVDGRIYTIEHMMADADGVFLFLKECGNGDCYFHECFRPLVERKTDISVFQALLNPVKQKEDA